MVLARRFDRQLARHPAEAIGERAQSAKCVVCDADAELYAPYRLAQANSPFHAALPELSIYSCQVCGTRQADHAKISSAHLADYYERSYRREVSVGRGERSMFHRRARSIYKSILPYLARADHLNIFEVGAGNCTTLVYLAKRLPKPILATDETDQSLIPPQIAIGQLNGARRDVVILSHVLEHIPYPREFLSTVHDALAPGAVLYIEVPNELDRAVLSNAYHEPHITFFNYQSLAYLLDLCFPDMDVMEYGTAGVPQWQHHPHTLFERLNSKVWRLGFALENAATTGGYTAAPPQRLFRLKSRPTSGVWLRAVLTKPNLDDVFLPEHKKIRARA